MATYSPRNASQQQQQSAEPRGSLAELLARYQQVRRFSELICEPLEVEDFVVQSMADVSPTRWHLAHTTWFFETFVLARWEAAYRPANAAFEHLFNSYYNAVGEQFPRPRRGLLTRPTVAEVFAYRRQVDQRLAALVERFSGSSAAAAELYEVMELGVHHEQQHQELMLTDLKHVFSCNPLYPVYRPASGGAERPPAESGSPTNWIGYDERLVEIGLDGPQFGYDNERPRHRTFLEAFQLADALVTNGEFLEFIDDGGYRRPELWLSLGWAAVQEHGWEAPLYWMRHEGQWLREFTLAGLRPLEPAEPVCHVSFFEADAFARWRGARLPSEAEWEHAAAEVASAGSFVESGRYHPAPVAADAPTGPRQLYGELWQWTASAYLAYPGYRPPEGALGEYNGKFMCNQFVLRGGSCATSASHIRPTYRNFFPPEARWQFSGIRLAK